MKVDVVARDVNGTEIDRWHFHWRWIARRWVAREIPPPVIDRRPMWTYTIENPQPKGTS